MEDVLLHEAAGSLHAQEGGKWSAVLLTPGKGSSGTYSESVLNEYGPTAFPKGTKMFFGHPKPDSGPGDRDPRDQWGVLDEAAQFVAGEGLTGKIRLLPHWKDVVESLGDQAALSIYAMGESDNDGNITKLTEHVTNSVDMVSHPGRPGSGLKQKLEAARAAFDKPGSPSGSDSTHTQEVLMDPKELKSIVAEALADALTPVTAFFAAEEARRAAEAAAEDKGTETKDAIEAFAAASKAISEAELLPEQEAELIEAAKAGEDVTARIASEKKKLTQFEERTNKVTVSEGYVHKPTAGAQDDFTVIGFGSN